MEYCKINRWGCFYSEISCDFISVLKVFLNWVFFFSINEVKRCFFDYIGVDWIGLIIVKMWLVWV